MSQFNIGAAGGGGGGTITEVDGTTNQITSTNPTGPIVTLSIPTTFIAPGTIASTTTNAAGTNFLLPTGSSTAGMILQNQGGLVRVFSTLGIDNIFAGRLAGNTGLTVGVSSNNTGIGASSLSGAGFTTGSANTALGVATLNNATFNGSSNIAVGSGVTGLQAGSIYSGTESSNILLGNAGVVGDNNTMRLGTTGSGNGQVSTAFIAGTQGVTPSGTLQTVVINSSGQLGSAALPTPLVIWSNISASQTLAVNNGYICSSGGALSLALPATSAVGDIIEIVLDGSTSWTITQASGQQIRVSNTASTSGATGSVASLARGDAIRMVCRTANTLWTALSTSGALSIT